MPQEPKNKIDALLENRRSENCLRTLKPAIDRCGGKIEIAGKQYYDFCSNDYLGLSAHESLKRAATEATNRYGTGAAASRLLSGDYEIFHELEAAIAALKSKPAALCFNSGYQANTGILAALCDKSSIIIADKLSHASIIDGAKLSGARLLRFAHNDINHLEKLLLNHGDAGNITVVTESVFSMDGDIAPLVEIAALKNTHDFTLIVDEAHATGVFGPNGGGLCSDDEINPAVDIIIGTFGKALGSFGAYATCNEKIKKFLINACRSFIYSTALPPAVIAANLAAIEVIHNEKFRREALLGNSDRFRNRLQSAGLKVLGQSQIIPIILDSEILDEAANKLKKLGYWVLPIKPPTVPAASSRLRFSLSYDHSDEITDKLADDVIATVNELTHN